MHIRARLHTTTTYGACTNTSERLLNEAIDCHHVEVNVSCSCGYTREKTTELRHKEIRATIAAQNKIIIIITIHLLRSLAFVKLDCRRKR